MSFETAKVTKYMGEEMMSLKPPPGYESWLDYAIETMDTRTIFLDQLNGPSPWGRIVQREEMREAARQELAELRAAKDQLLLDLSPPILTNRKEERRRYDDGICGGKQADNGSS